MDTELRTMSRPVDGHYCHAQYVTAYNDIATGGDYADVDAASTVGYLDHLLHWDADHSRTAREAVTID